MWRGQNRDAPVAVQLGWRIITPRASKCWELVWYYATDARVCGPPVELRLLDYIVCMYDHPSDSMPATSRVGVRTENNTVIATAEVAFWNCPNGRPHVYIQIFNSFVFGQGKFTRCKNVCVCLYVGPARPYERSIYSFIRHR